MTNYPYSDPHMVYDRDLHRYVLTAQGVAERLGEDLSARLNRRGGADPTALVNAVLRQVSTIVYGYIYNTAGDRFVAEFLAAKHPAAREIIRTALEQQLLYLLANGDISKVSGINTRTGGAMSRNAIKEARLDPMCEDILAQELDGTGIRLTYAGRMNTFRRFPCYHEEGY